MNINIKECLEKARGAEDCKEFLEVIELAGDNWREIPELPYYLYWYARYVIQSRWPEAEAYILKDPCWAYWYAKEVIEGRWPEAEDTIKKNPELAYMYAQHVLRSRWPEAEANIIKDPYRAYEYSMYVVKDNLEFNGKEEK